MRITTECIGCSSSKQAANAASLVPGSRPPTYTVQSVAIARPVPVPVGDTYYVSHSNQIAKIASAAIGTPLPAPSRQLEPHRCQS